jgi:hypothetical protein
VNAHVSLAAERYPDRRGEPTSGQGLPEVAADAVPRVGERAAVHDARCRDAVDLVEREVELRPVRLPILRHARGLTTCRVVRPLGQQEQPQREPDGHLAARERERHQRRAVRGLARGPGVLAGHADRPLALLQQGRVGDDPGWFTEGLFWAATV